MLQRLQQRDHYALLLYAFFGALIVVVGEAAASYVGMADRYGFRPRLLRGMFYLRLTVALWAVLLRTNRRMVATLINEKRQGYESVLRAYDSVLSLKDSDTGGHGHRVARNPDRLYGTHIRLAARIIAVADAFDALSSNHSYRRGVSTDQALNISAQAAGSRFDSEVVAAIGRKPRREALLAAHGEIS